MLLLFNSFIHIREEDRCKSFIKHRKLFLALTCNAGGAGGEKGVAIICWNDNDLKLESRKQMLLLTILYDQICCSIVIIIICSFIIELAA